MPSTIWKGHLTFGLVSIPVKLFRAARADKVSFRQLHAGTGARVRQSLVAEAPPEPEYDEAADAPGEDTPPARSAGIQRSAPAAAFTAPAPAAEGQTRAGQAKSAPPEPLQMPRRGAAPVFAPSPTPDPEPREVSRSEIVKGYEYAKNQYVTLTKEELAGIAPQTAREMQILEFVKLAEVDPIYFETSYYCAPDKGGERAYSLLFEAMRTSQFVGVAQVAMHNREHIVVIRSGRRGIVLHTMYYENEIRREDEYHADTSKVSSKELELASLLIRNLEAPFQPEKYRDSYREKLDALIQAKIEGSEVVEPSAPKNAPVVNILEALQRSLESAAGNRKPPATAEEKPQPRSGSRRKTSR